MFEIQLRWSHVHQSRHICSYSGVLKCTLLLSVTFYALQAFKILPFWAGIENELPKWSFFPAKNLICNMGRPPQCFYVLLAIALKLTCVFSNLLQKFGVDPLCVLSPVLGPAWGDLVHCSGLELYFSSLVTEAQSTRGQNKPQNPCELRCCFLCAFKLLWWKQM